MELRDLPLVSWANSCLLTLIVSSHICKFFAFFLSENVVHRIHPLACGELANATSARGGSLLFFQHFSLFSGVGGVWNQNLNHEWISDKRKIWLSLSKVHYNFFCSRAHLKFFFLNIVVNEWFTQIAFRLNHLRLMVQNQFGQMWSSLHTHTSFLTHHSEMLLKIASTLSVQTGVIPAGAVCTS